MEVGAVDEERNALAGMTIHCSSISLAAPVGGKSNGTPIMLCRAIPRATARPKWRNVVSTVRRPTGPLQRLRPCTVNRAVPARKTSA